MTPKTTPLSDVETIRLFFHEEAEKSEKGMVRMPIEHIDNLLDQVAMGSVGALIVEPEPRYSEEQISADADMVAQLGDRRSDQNLRTLLLAHRAVVEGELLESVYQRDWKVFPDGEAYVSVSWLLRLLNDEKGGRR